MKLLFFMLTLSFSSLTSAQSAPTCAQIIAQESARITEKRGYTKHVGGHLYTNPWNGQLGYYPGIPVAGKISNWARDFDKAIKWGPLHISAEEDDRRRILEGFHKSIKRHCKLPNDNHQRLRGMLKELLEEDAFCRNGTFLERPLLRPWRNYHRVLADAVKSGRFSEVCLGSNVVSESHREIKDTSAPSAGGAASPGASAR